MFTRIPNNYYDYPMWEESSMNYPCEMEPDIDFETSSYTRQEFPPGGTTAPPPRPGTTGGPSLVVQPAPPVQRDVNYTQGWLTTQIGKYVKIEFLIGTNMLIDREGTLTEVGISYVVIRESGTKNTVMCDIYAIKFVTVFFNQDTSCR
ncbi:hypothetical protein [uncultured Clostridium sp.]|uniref:hypothetical protein n=1 Tax=uncultured Clostridium sp. TaxID=59620 RepID=UPI0028E75501|nr:hypothetical protein [uncultured Clostridium sp.]